ncbi:MAG TPA: hypothetical protein VG942_03520 [Hyphomonadaceae bacterium]|nr:hypothetical protein [Hyphomonadaceae bacterium]
MRGLVLSAAILTLALLAPSALPQAAPAGPRPMPTAEQRKDDLAAFRSKFLAVDKSYSPEARAEAEQRLSVLDAKVDTISNPAFELELARIVALANNGHTHYVLGSISRYYNRIPIRLSNFGADFDVVRAEEADADLLGAKLVSIDGHPIEELRKAGRQLWGGTDAWRDQFAFNLFESPELLFASNLAKANDAATYVFQTRDGRAVERKLAGEPAGDKRPFSNPVQVRYPEKLPLEDASWRTALSAAKAPWALQEGGEPFRWRAAPEVKGIVIELRQNVDSDGHKIADALKTFQDAIDQTKPTNIVLDMRDNGGGNLNTTRVFMQSLPKLATGRVFVLTGPMTFSAAISSVGYLKQAGGDRVTIVGEPVGDRMMFWAEGRGADLPNNRGQIGLATQRHDYAGGCKAYTDCHFSVKVSPIAVASLAPDIAAPWTIEAYMAGRDPGMEAIIAALK